MSARAREEKGAQEPGAAPPPARLGATRIGRGLAAGLAAWLLPGLGHWVVGARRKAIVFFAVVASAVTTGFALHGNLAVSDPRTPFISRLQVVTNLAMGPIEPVMRAALYGALVYNGGDSLLPGPRRPALERRRTRGFSTYSSYGTTYLLAAGLMNILLILDAWDIAIGRKSKD